MVYAIATRGRITCKKCSRGAILTAIKFTLNEAKSVIVSYVNRDPCLKLNTKMLNIWQAHHSLFIMESNMKSILCSFSDSLS